MFDLAQGVRPQVVQEIRGRATISITAMRTLTWRVAVNWAVNGPVLDPEEVC